MTDTQHSTNPKRGISRRTVVQGTAWAVPAVVVATAAPAMAASPCLGVTFGAQSCKQPGGGQNNFGYKLNICFTNGCGSTQNIVVTKVQGNTGSSPEQPVNQTITLTANQQGCLPSLVVYCSSNSTSKINVYYTVNGGAEQVQTVDSPPQNCATTPILCPPA